MKGAAVKMSAREGLGRLKSTKSFQPEAERHCDDVYAEGDTDGRVRESFQKSEIGS